MNIKNQLIKNRFECVLEALVFILLSFVRPVIGLYSSTRS